MEKKTFEMSFRGWTRFLSVYNTVELDIAVCAFNPSTWEAESDRALSWNPAWSTE